MVSQSKKCRKCDEFKPLEQFYKCRSREVSKDGHHRLCKSCQNAQYRKWRDTNRAHANALARKYASRQPEKRKPKQREYYLKNREERLLKAAKYSRNLRMAAMDAYGGKFCACCGEQQLLFLTIDHKLNDGNQHRREISGKNVGGGGTVFYRWLRNKGYPDGFQVLCMNCNFGKRMNHGVCPHLPSGIEIEEV